MFKKIGLFKKIAIFLGVLGPSVITTMAGNDGGGVITYSFSGAQLGYAVLITLPFLTILYGITQEMGSRIAIVTGKGLGDLVRERFGVRTALAIFALLLIANFGSILTNVAAVKTASQLLSIPSTPFVILTIAVAYLFVTLASYQKSQKIFLAGIVFYFAYIFSAIKGNPDFGHAVTSMFIPSSSVFSKEFLIIGIAVLGTTITPWGQFFVQSYMKDKNLPLSRVPYGKLEAYVGAFVSNFFTFFIMVATAATLFVNQIPLESGEQAAMAIKPFAGELSGILFAVGLVSAAIIGMIIVSLCSAYAFSEFFGFSGSLDDKYKKGKVFYTIFLVNMILAGLIVITPHIDLFKIVLYTQSLNGILLPVFFFYILKIINNKDLMGEYTNGKLYNYFAYGSSILIVIAAVTAASVGLLGL